MKINALYYLRINIHIVDDDVRIKFFLFKVFSKGTEMTRGTHSMTV